MARSPSWGAIEALKSRIKARLKNSRYHFKQTCWPKIRNYQTHLSDKKHLPWLDLLYCSWRYGATPLDYYCLRFFEKTHRERQQYLTTSRIFALRQATAETPEKTLILRDKFLFNQKFQPYLGRDFWTWEQLLAAPALPPTLVMKARWGQGGEKIRLLSGVQDKQACLQSIQELVSHPADYLYESLIVQHPALEALYAGGVNTLKVLTCLHNQAVEVWGVMLSLGTRAHIDNFMQDGIALGVNAQGLVDPNARYLDPHEPPITHHPHTGQDFQNFRVPFFKESLALCEQAAREIPDVRTITWDVAIQPDGPCLIEGNHNWNAYIQIPMQQGLAPRARAVISLAPYD